jgi:uncharacterized protein YjiS (DUF1127 family)
MFHCVLNTVRKWRVRRQALETLARLTERQLRDMGVYRPYLKSTRLQTLDAA